jgi:hypothetical protein
MSATKFGVLSAAIPVGGGTKTGAVQTGPNCIPVGVLTPAAMTGTAITFEVLVQGETTYQPLYNGSSVYTLTVAANRYVALSPDVMLGVQDLKVVSGSSESAGVTFKVIQRPVR